MAIDAKNLVVAAKVYSRGIALPLDASELYSSLEEAQSYAKSPIAYAGQTIKVLQDGKYETYVLNGEAGAYTLDKIGVDSSQIKNPVKVVTELPGEGQEQGTIYINTTDSKGYIWNGESWVTIFEEIEGGIAAKLTELEGKFAEYAPLSGATFTGTVTLAADPSENLEAATKQYVDRLVGGLNDFTVGVVDNSDNPLPATDYKVGQTFRVAEAGTFAGQECEAGDLIIVIKDYAEEGASDADFLVVQTNIDGAVTGAAASTDANIVVFDGITGKKIKDSSVSLTSLQDAIAKAHEHANKTQLDSYNKTQEELLQEAATAVDGKLAPINEAIAQKADKTALDSYYTKVDIDGKLQTITDSVNTKVDGATVDSKIAEKVGEIGEGTTVKEYVDTAVGSGGADVAEQILQAKNEAIQTSKTYTDTAMTITEF